MQPGAMQPGTIQNNFAQPGFTLQPNSAYEPSVALPPGTTPPPGAMQPGGAAQPNIGMIAVPTAPAPSGRRLRAFSRSSVKVQVKWIPNPNNPQEWVGVISPGVNLIIDGLPGFGQLDISTDRMVVWTSGNEEPDLSGNRAQGADRPMQLYLEGNVRLPRGRPHDLRRSDVLRRQQ